MRLGGPIDLVLASPYVIFLPYYLFLLATSLAAILRGRRKSWPHGSETGRTTPRSRFIVVIPAYDEEGGVTATVLSCRALNYPPELFQVVVIADNCTDRTAERAASAGARVVERFDGTRKSKGYAIEYLIETLRQSGEFDTWDALVIVDADSTVHPDLLRVFAQGLESGHDWIQCFDCVGNPTSSWRTQLMAYAFSLINGVTLLGQNALGLSAALRGNGMCLSIKGLRRVPWASHGLTEELEYSWSVRIAGGRIAFTREARVYATMLVQGGSAMTNQRRRWESGRHELRWKKLGPLLRSPHLGWFEKAACVIELTMPTAVFLIGLYFLLTLGPILYFADLLARQSLLLIASMALFQAVATLGLVIHAVSPFLLSFLPWRFVLSLIYFPSFVLWKILILFRRRPHAWLRTPRETDLR
jgi:cellulose synthase/poly-beta-1,6-N-acetylglucosamine synthase-like glycosyltransferase